MIFCSSNPFIWDSDVNAGPRHFAKPLTQVANDVCYLRLRRNSDYVIVAINKDRLKTRSHDGLFGFEGCNVKALNGRHLGVFDVKHTDFQNGDASIGRHHLCKGWGFGHVWGGNAQSYSWNGEVIAPCTFEIAVKAGDLTDEESEKLQENVIKTDPIKPERLAGPGITKDWDVIFCSANPSLWDRDVKRGPNRFAKLLSKVDNGIRFLRIRRDGDYVIVPIRKESLKKLSHDNHFGFEGTNEFNYNGYHLGVVDVKRKVDKGDVCIGQRLHAKGWGFGHFSYVDNVQAYTWNGKTVDPCVFEIAVKTSNLTEEESKKLLDHILAIKPITPQVLEGEGISKDWQVLFSSGNPEIWNSNTDKPGQFAQTLDKAPEETSYLRLRRNAEYVIVPMTKDRLDKVSQQGQYGWAGQRDEKNGVFRLGVFDSRQFPRIGSVLVRGFPSCSGWGFGHLVGRNYDQGYCWNGDLVEPCELEVAVKKGALTAEEKKHLLGQQ